MFHERVPCPAHIKTRENSSKATRRRTRRPDSLASARAIEALLESLRSSLPDFIPKSHKFLSSLLNTVRGLYMRRPTETKRGRPARFIREPNSCGSTPSCAACRCVKHESP